MKSAFCRRALRLAERLLDRAFGLRHSALALERQTARKRAEALTGRYTDNTMLYLIGG